MTIRNIPVLCYHDMNNGSGMSLDMFKRHLDVIRDTGWTTISASHLLDICRKERKPGPKCLVLTFDDCHLSNWLYTIPLLADYNMTGVFFAITDFIGTGPRRTLEKNPGLERSARSFKMALDDNDFSQFMNEEEIRAAITDYGMEVFAHSSRHQCCFKNLRTKGIFNEHAHWGAHSIYTGQDFGQPVFERGSAYAYNGFWPQGRTTGPKFRLRTDNERFQFCKQDFKRSLERIRELNHAGKQLFCLPWGEFDELTLRALKETGFDGSFTLERSFNGPGTDPFRLNRIGVARKKDESWLRNRLCMHRTSFGARIFFKYFRKKGEFQRVLYITDSKKRSSGGIRQLLFNAQGLKDAGVQTFIAAPENSKIAGTLAGSEIPFVPLKQPSSVVRTALFLHRFCSRESIDTVHTFHNKMVKTAVTAKLLGARFKLFLNRGVLFKPNPLYGIFSLLSDGFVCNSHACAQTLKKYFVPRKKLHVVFNAFEQNHAVEPGDTPGIRITYIGNTKPVKGFDIFLQTVQHLLKDPGTHDWEFHAYGVEHKQDRFSQIPGHVRDRVIKHGTVSHEKILQGLAVSSVFVLTSRQESMPNTLLEAFGAGLPVVCSCVGGIKDLVKDGGNGYLCPPGDIQCFAGSISCLARDPELCTFMGRTNRQLVQRELTVASKGYNLLRLYSGEHLQQAITIKPLDTENNPT